MVQKILDKLLKNVLILIEKIKQNKKKASIIFVILSIIIISFIIIKYQERRQLEIEKNTDITNSIHAIVINDNTKILKTPKNSMFTMFGMAKKGENVYILEELSDNKNGDWCKVKYKNRIGYMLQENIDYFKESEEEFVLMSDVSKFNVIYKHFQSSQDYQIFLIENNIQYVYIRAGGRGYGEEGKFYTDPNFQIFIDACEYLKVPYGFYYIDEALTSEEVDEEVEFMYDFITKNATSKNILPLVIDIEKYDDNIKARTRDIWEDRKYLATELVDKFLAKGISSIIYTNANIANKYLYEVNTCFWLAYYDQKDKVPNYWYTSLEDQEPIQNEELMNKMIAWQFSESGAGKEIDLNVDLNLVKNDFFIEYVKKYTKDK